MYRIVIFFLLVHISCADLWAQNRERSRPNIILIMADDLGFGDLGCYGQQVIQTPRIDQMAREGIRFAQCYAGSPVCAPSRSVLMTGMHTGHTTVRGNFGKTGVVGLGGGKGRVPLKAEDYTLAEMMKDAGYVTGMTGKWGLGEPNTSGHPNVQGFDEFMGFLNQRRAHHYFVEYLWHNEERVMLAGNMNGKAETYVHDLFTDFALDFIEQHQDTNFFLYLPYTVPHDEYEIQDTLMYEDQPWHWEEKVHAAMVTTMDRDVGRMLDLLDSLELTDHTLVFFCSDNGAARRWEGRFDSSGPLRGRKRDLYEGGIRTPMIVRWPGRIPADTLSHQPWYFADMLPTLADLVEMDLPYPVDGVSVWPTIQGKNQDLKERYFYWEFHERGFQQAARKGGWKAIRLEKNAPLELYHLSQDPIEKRNVADQYPDRVEAFEVYLDTARTTSVDWPGE